MGLRETMAEILAAEKAGKIEPMDLKLPSRFFWAKLGAVAVALAALVIAGLRFIGG